MAFVYIDDSELKCDDVRPLIKAWLEAGNWTSCSLQRGRIAKLWLYEGWPVRRIAKHLNVTTSTVRIHQRGLETSWKHSLTKLTIGEVVAKAKDGADLDAIPMSMLYVTNVRLKHALEMEDHLVKTILDAMVYPNEEYLKIPNFGRKALHELHALLEPLREFVPPERVQAKKEQLAKRIEHETNVRKYYNQMDSVRRQEYLAQQARDHIAWEAAARELFEWRRQQWLKTEEKLEGRPSDKQ